MNTWLLILVKLAPNILSTTGNLLLAHAVMCAVAHVLLTSILEGMSCLIDYFV